MHDPEEAPGELPLTPRHCLLTPRHGLNLVLLILGLLLTVGLLVQMAAVYPGLVFTEFGLLLLPTWLFCRRLGLAPVPTLLLAPGRPLPPLAAVAMGLLAFAMALALTFPVLLLVFLAGGSYVGPILPLETGGQFLMALAAGAVAAPICEEILFRGFVLRSLAPLGPHVAVWGSALLFGLFHMDPVRLVPTMVLGVVYGYMAAGTGSVRSSMVAHAVNNGLALTLAFMGGGGDKGETLDLESLRLGVARTMAKSGTGLNEAVSPDLILAGAAVGLSLLGLILAALVAMGLRGLAGRRPHRFCLPDMSGATRLPMTSLLRLPSLWAILGLGALIWGRGLWQLFSGHGA
ncbi:MAG: CPBP family intramembrane metalloprotease [Acidobacteria bacterium]|nr:MAG: CPBP family intramembrane metalloprotease [Acidobacteriota bacterium]